MFTSSSGFTGGGTRALTRRDVPCFSYGAWSTGNPVGYPCWLTQSRPEFITTTSTITAPSQVYALHVNGRNLIPRHASNATNTMRSMSSATIVSKSLNTPLSPTPVSSEATVANIPSKLLSQGQLIGIIFGGITLFLFFCIGSCVWLYRYKHKPSTIPHSRVGSSKMAEFKSELPGQDQRFEIAGGNPAKELMSERGLIRELYTREHFLELSARDSLRIDWR
jgi:hypothetical protein